MANYSVTKYTIVKGTIEDVITELETKIETVDDSKTIRLLQVLGTPDRQYMGIIIYDT